MSYLARLKQAEASLERARTRTPPVRTLVPLGACFFSGHLGMSHHPHRKREEKASTEPPFPYSGLPCTGRVGLAARTGLGAFITRHALGDPSLSHSPSARLPTSIAARHCSPHSLALPAAGGRLLRL